MPKNKLLPESSGKVFWNFIQNFFWAIVWLGRSSIRLLRQWLHK